MNIYKILQLAGNNRMPRFVKMLGLWAIHIAGRRHIGIFLDPVLGCNLRCRMCYFSNPERRAKLKGTISTEQLNLVENTFFKHALKLQIGCGAEPTLYKDLTDIVRRAKRQGIPNISLVTNGQLIANGHVDIAALTAAGIDEIIISMHGTGSDTYEYLMPGARYDNMVKLLGLLANVRKENPDFRVRINFTVNSMNIRDLEGDKFRRPWPEGFRPDVIQLRPVQNIGGTEWTDYDMTSLKEAYDSTIRNITEYCRANGITCIAPTKEQIDEVAGEQDGDSALIEDITYCYISPESTYKDDFELGKDSFKSYHRRKHTGQRLFAAAFRKTQDRSRHSSKKLNYKVR